MADRDSCLGRMVFPIHDERGELVAYAGRLMDGRESRAICFRRDSANRRWFLISIARSSRRPGKGV